MFSFRLILSSLYHIYNNNYNNNCLARYTSLHFCSRKNFSVDLYNGDHQTTTVFFASNFTQGWLDSYNSSSALSCLFIVRRNILTIVLKVECSCSRFLENECMICVCVSCTYSLLLHCVAFLLSISFKHYF